MNIYLIGYRCTGKTSVGRTLAAKLGWPFIDTDSEIVKEQGTSISDRVHKQGWEAFREKEREVVRRVCTLDRHVVATGGGVVLDNENIEQMKKTGVLVWLKASPKNIEERMLKDRHTGDFRPALTSKGLTLEIEETLRRRYSYYEKAGNLSIDTDDISVEDMCSILADKLRDSIANQSRSQNNNFT
jgi:shikimate kinase